MHPLELSSKIIDTQETLGVTTRITNELSEINQQIAIIESFSHSIVFRTSDGLVVFDTSGVYTGQEVVKALRSWNKDRINKIVYTHGHVDHVGGSGFFGQDAVVMGYDPPAVLGHLNIAKRFLRYREMQAWNLAINARQFGLVSSTPELSIGGRREFLPENILNCNTTYADELVLNCGDLNIILYHALGETDDHTWAWIPEHKAICCGDLFIWLFPNAGNPQKVQRYPREWAAALDKMISLEPELLLPAHGLPVQGKERIKAILCDVRDVLNFLVDQVISLMNENVSLNSIIHEVKIDEALLKKPWLAPLYDEPEFVIRNIWRLYGGWWDLDPAHLKPVNDEELANAIVALSGGVENLIKLALNESDNGNLRLAAQLIEYAFHHDQFDKTINAARAKIYERLQESESSLMAKGIYNEAKSVSKERS
jgi:alkyl sulfatase BDS1-like metallo-beta-lactamase superfamily hydrolase